MTHEVQRSGMKILLSDSLRSCFRQLEHKITLALKKEWAAATAKTHKHARCERTSNTESGAAAEELTKFLRGIEASAACDVVAEVKSVVNIIYKMCLSGTVDDMSKIVQDFYQRIYHRFNEHHLYKGLNPRDAHFLNTLVERYLMSLTYTAVFESICTENEEEDLAMYQRIRAHSWVSAKHLGLRIDEENASVRKATHLAIMETQDLENKENPDAKLECVVRCSKYLCQALRVDKKVCALVSVDELLRATVWMLLRANPSFLHSNIKYITWFGAPTKVLKGEAAYYFTNLCYAVSFIKTLTNGSVHVPFGGAYDYR